MLGVGGGATDQSFPLEWRRECTGLQRVTSSAAVRSDSREVARCMGNAWPPVRSRAEQMVRASLYHGGSSDVLTCREGEVLSKAVAVRAAGER